MPHDRDGKQIKAGDRVILRGTVVDVTGEQETFCNVLFMPDEAMAPDTDPQGMALSARMLESIPANPTE